MWAITLVCLCVLLDYSDAGVPRRDEEYPPKDFLIELEPIRIACRKKIYVTDEAIERFSNVEVHEDEQLKCYMNCLFHEYGVVDDDGEAHFEKIMKKIPDSMKEIANNMLSKCLHPQGENLCERAFWLHKCFKELDPVHYFII